MSFSELLGISLGHIVFFFVPVILWIDSFIWYIYFLEWLLCLSLSVFVHFILFFCEGKKVDSRYTSGNGLSLLPYIIFLKRKYLKIWKTETVKPPQYIFNKRKILQFFHTPSPRVLANPFVSHKTQNFLHNLFEQLGLISTPKITTKVIQPTNQQGHF